MERPRPEVVKRFSGVDVVELSEKLIEKRLLSWQHTHCLLKFLNKSEPGSPV
jgi:hypothetical protein